MAEETKLRGEQAYAEQEYREGKKAGHMEAGAKKRPNVLKLCRHIQDLPGAVVQYGDPEYNALACWVSDDEVRVAMTMKLRKHYTIEQLAKMAKMPLDKC